MKETMNGKPAPAAGLYPIRTVSELTGVNAITLRAWENRYGLVKPVRKESGHRLYSQDDIDLINRVVGLLDRGIRIGQVKGYLESQEAEQVPQGAGGDTSGKWKRYRDGMIAAIIRFDESALEALYGEALSQFEVNTVTRRLLEPLLAEIGQRWASGIGTVAEEHFFGCYLRNKLGARFHHRVRNTGGEKLIMACPPGERHEVGLLLFALEANAAGFDPVVLGPDMPLSEIPPVVTKTGAVAVILSASGRRLPGFLERELPKLVETARVPVFIGGRLSIENLDELRRAGAHPLGADIDTGLKHVRSVLSDTRE